jgi:hypothetical protein
MNADTKRKQPGKALSKILLALIAVAALSLAHPASANLITNPGFETGNTTGWTAVGSGVLVLGTVQVAPHSGNFQARLGNPGGAAGSLTQFLATTPSSSYTIDFWLANPLGTDNFIVSWGGAPILSLTNPGVFGYTEYTFTETASTASTSLSFVSPGGGSIFFLDDVSVEPAGVGVPDGGSTVSLLGSALLGLAALRRKLGC